MTVLSIAWLPVLVVPLVAHLSPAAAGAFTAVDYLVWALFTVEYSAKLLLSPERWRFVRSHPIDLLVIAVPFLRPLRAARLLRLLKLGRVGVVMVEALGRARAILTHRRLHFVLLAVVVIMFACAGAILSFEARAPGSNIHNFGDALWWAIVTVTTVGYGDHYPVTAAGRGIAVVLMLVGIGLVGVLTASIASFFVEQKQDAESAELNQRLERMEALLVHLAGDRAVELLPILDKSLDKSESRVAPSALDPS